jgi:hypothetical protein
MPKRAAIMVERLSGRRYSGNSRSNVASANYGSRTRVQRASSRDRAPQDMVEIAPDPGTADRSATGCAASTTVTTRSERQHLVGPMPENDL